MDSEESTHNQLFYCICCTEVYPHELAMDIFTTGFRRNGHQDIPLGICKKHLDEYALRDESTQ